MDRRTFNKLAGMAAMGAVADSSHAQAESASTAAYDGPMKAEEVILEDDQLRVAFHKTSGALLSLEAKKTSWVMEHRPELGISFRLLAPLPERRDNFVLGQKQNAVEVKKIASNKIQLRWDNLLSEHGGVLQMAFTAVVTLTNGALSFQSTLENRTSLTVETIDYPYFGDLKPPARDTPMAVRTMWYGNLGSDEIYPGFGSEKGYWGVDYPTKTFGSNRSSFCLIQAPQQGLYIEMSDPSLPYYLEYTFVQHPGVLYGSAVPETDTISGFPVHLEFRTCHFLFAQAHSVVTLAPIVMRCYQGDWHAGVDLYKEWRASWFKPSQLPEWCKEVHSWTMLRMNTPEEDYTISYSKFAEYCKEYAANGVKAVQLVGWNIGGQDRDDPSQDTDPHLGTWQQFHDSIAAGGASGVKVILFGKLGWADLTTPRYKDELYKYQAIDPYGIPYQTAGYSYVTPTQLAGINNRRRAVMDVLDPGYQDIALKEFQKILALGAAGWLWDEVCHHGSALYNFAAGHGYAPPGYIYKGDLPLSSQLRAAANKVNPDFIFAGEGQQDWLMQYYPVSETGVSATPICQYIDRHCLLLAGVSGFDDREKLNAILMYRYVIQYEPFFYKGHLTDFPLTLAYGHKIDALRRKYKEYLWDGEYRETLGANVSGNGAHHYSVFVTAEGKRAVVVINNAPDKALTVTVSIPGAGKLITATPDELEAKPSNGILQIPARSAIVLMESTR